MKKGFALVEVVIIICVIGILSAISIPAFMKAREKAQMARAAEESKNKSVVVADINPTVSLEKIEGEQVADDAQISLTPNGITFSIDGKTIQVSNKSFVIESFSMGGITLRSSPPSQDVIIRIKRR